MSLALLFHYLLLNIFRMLIHPSSGACDLFDELFHGLYCSGSMCIGVTLWFGWGGVVTVCRLKHCIRIPHQHASNQSNTTHEITQQISRKLLSLHPDNTPPQPNHNVTPTRTEPEQYNP